MKKFLGILGGILIGAGGEYAIIDWYHQLQHPAFVDSLYSIMNDIRLTVLLVTVVTLALVAVYYMQYRKMVRDRIALEDDILER